MVGKGEEMREFKFRAWDSKQKGMINSPMYEKGMGVVVINDTFKKAQDDEFVIMQYTGLKDKNGKEIYEGDIVKGKSIGIITWDLTCCWYSVVSNLVKYPIKPYTEILFNNGEEWEIIGNIHENPELLEGE